LMGVELFENGSVITIEGVARYASHATELRNGNGCSWIPNRSFECLREQ
jgi:hypothetical protein